GGTLASSRLHAIRRADLDGSDAIANNAAAAPGKIGCNGGNLPIGIDRHALIWREQTDGVIGPDLRVECEDVPSPKPVDPNVVLLSPHPRRRALAKRFFIGIEVDWPLRRTMPDAPISPRVSTCFSNEWASKVDSTRAMRRTSLGSEARTNRRS